MPKHKEGYVSKEIARLQKHKSILSIAQWMHESIGSCVAECAPEKIIDEWGKILQFYDDYWVEELRSAYDFSVRMLIRAVLSEYKRYNNKLKINDKIKITEDILIFVDEKFPTKIYKKTCLIIKDFVYVGLNKYYTLTDTSNNMSLTLAWKDLKDKYEKL